MSEKEKDMNIAPETVDTDGEYYVKFKKPFVFEGQTYDGIDLSGLEDLKAMDMIETQRQLNKSGNVSTFPEMSVEYACIFAAKATKLPQEFFQWLPPREAIKVKNRVVNFFYGQG